MSLLTKERPGMVMQLIYLKICLVFHFFRRLNRYRWQRLHEQDKAHRLLRDFSIPSQTHLSSRALAQLCRRFSHWLTLHLQLVSGGCRWISLRKQPRLSSLLTTRCTSRGVRRRGGGGGPHWRGSVSSPPSEFRSLLSELSDRISVLMT